MAMAMASPPAKRSTPRAAAVAPATAHHDCLPAAGKKGAYDHNGHHTARSEKTRLRKALDMLRRLLVPKGWLIVNGGDHPLANGSHVDHALRCGGGDGDEDGYIPTEADLKHLRDALHLKLDPAGIDRAEYVKLKNMLLWNGGREATFERASRGLPITRPDPEGPRFRGLTNLDDDRTDLWAGQRNEENRMLEVCVLASKFAYENRARATYLATNKLQGKDSTFFNSLNVLQNTRSVQCLAFVRVERQRDVVYVAFRGTDEWADWWTNLGATQIDMGGGFGRVHRGFMTALGLLDRFRFDVGFPRDLPRKYQADPPAYYALRAWVTEKLRALDELASKSRRPRPLLRVVGHSLGGALAVAFVAVLLYHGWQLSTDRVEVVTMGQPRVGDTVFASRMRAYYRRQPGPGFYSLRYTRMVYRHDPVTRLPAELDPWRLGLYSPYRHFGTCLYYDGWFNKIRLTDDTTMPNENIDPTSLVTLYVEKVVDEQLADKYKWLLMESDDARERRKKDILAKYYHFIGEYLNAARHGGSTTPAPRRLHHHLMQAILHPRSCWGPDTCITSRSRHIIANYNEGPSQPSCMINLLIGRTSMRV